VVAGLFEIFSVLNRVFLTGARYLDMTYKTTTRINADVTSFDSLFGDETGQISGSLTTVSQGLNTDMKGSFDLAGLMLLFQTPYEVKENLDSLSQTDFELIYNAADETLYYKNSFASAAKDAWIAEVMPGGLSSILPADKTVGSLLYDTYCGETSGVHSVKLLGEEAQSVSQIIGDGCFTERCGGWDLAYGVDEIGLLFEELTGVHSEGLKDSGFTLRVEKNSGYSGSLLLTLRDYSEAVQIKVDFSVTDAGSHMAVSFHLKNQFKLNLTLQSVSSVTKEKLRSAPPAGETVIWSPDLGLNAGDYLLDADSLALTLALVS
jgi:hypothetical protein